ncbi:baculoviral IAP repeat-containing protein 5-like [Microcaecilia unicolor]|uniref:Baculoviral IAP repeat-containing protein 5-like n=1 Tax=Microcaecilia unicolor TaxID=1415580 RepID=A0A6P7YN89_9AMPH|nr:baculoviral IAP repeat-containing protein 5-like [Microcaecilia unicolor]XP_030064509.1 baculoviral IAP repeat-containing protein 5-like [Microcaecilia unicolor]
MLKAPLASLGDSEIPEQWRLYLLDSRIRTYSNWPFIEGCACTPARMAAAGFIHCPSENSPDVAQCFFCFKELEGWEPDDDPMEEHKKHSSGCAFINIKKKIENLSQNEFLKLDKERLKNETQKKVMQKIDQFQEAAKQVRSSIQKMGLDMSALE